MFFLPPFSSWAFKILNTAPLTRLDLVEVELVSRTSALVFGALTIPTLEHLRIISCSFPHDDLSGFLSRHNTISTLEVTGQDVYPLLITTLPALVSLKSNERIIADNLLTPTAFPKLARVCVAIQFFFPGGVFMFYATEGELARAAKQLTGTNIRLCLAVDMVTRPHPNNFVNFETWPNDLRHYPILGHVREISFSFPRRDVVVITALNIPTWLALFPLLEHIELLNTPIGFDYEAKMSFLRRIAQECAGIRTVKIGDDTRDISVWLSSDN
jgi:hypothetical protein